MSENEGRLSPAERLLKAGQLLRSAEMVTLAREIETSDDRYRALLDEAVTYARGGPSHGSWPGWFADGINRIFAACDDRARTAERQRCTEAVRATPGNVDLILTRIQGDEHP
jgi:hypothetical protein